MNKLYFELGADLSFWAQICNVLFKIHRRYEFKILKHKFKCRSEERDLIWFGTIVNHRFLKEINLIFYYKSYLIHPMIKQFSGKRRKIKIFF